MTESELKDFPSEGKAKEMKQKRLTVNVGMTLYETGHFDILNGTITAMLDLWLLYDAKLYEKLYNRKVLPWTMTNALELNVATNASWDIWGTSLDTVNFWSTKPGDKPDEKEDNADSEMKLFRVELYTLRVTVKFRTFQAEDPFQTIYPMLIFAIDGSPGSELTDYHAMPNNCCFPGFRKKIGDFSLCSQIIRNYEFKVPYGIYSRLYFIFEYRKSPYQDVFKYYLVPAFILALTIQFSHTVESLFDSLGAYFLATVALMFTLPNVGAFTRNEKAVVFGSTMMLVMLLVLVEWESDTSKKILWLTICVGYPCLILYDWFMARKNNQKVRQILFEGDLGQLDSV